MILRRKDELIFRMSRVGGRKREREGGGQEMDGSDPGLFFTNPLRGMINALPTSSHPPSFPSFFAV